MKCDEGNSSVLHCSAGGDCGVVKSADVDVKEEESPRTDDRGLGDQLGWNDEAVI